MNPEKAKTDLGHLRSSLLLQQIINIAMVLVCAVLLFKYLGAKDGEKIVQQTPDGDKSRWISTTSGPSVQTLNDAAMWMAHLTQDITPSNIDTNAQLLKVWIDPENWDDLKKKTDKSVAKMREMGAIQMFAPSVFTPDAPKLRVALTGESRKWIGDVSIPAETKTYVFQFKQSSTQLFLVDWYESSKQKPFERLEQAANKDATGKKPAK